MLQNTSALYCSSFTFQYRIVCTVVVQQRNNMMQNFFHQLSIIISLVVGRISSTSTSIKWENKLSGEDSTIELKVQWKGAIISYRAMSHYVCKSKTNKTKKLFISWTGDLWCSEWFQINLRRATGFSFLTLYRDGVYTAGGFVWCDRPFYLVKQPQKK